MPPPSTLRVNEFGSHTPMSHFIIDEASESEQDLADSHDLPTAAEAIKRFRLSGRRYLLTYAQCPEDPEEIYEFINRKRAVKQAVGCIELHQDGHPHVHIAVEFDKKLNSTDPRYFDYAYSGDCESYHPNISPATSWPRCINYCRGKNKTLIQLYQWKCTFQEALDSSAADRTERHNLFEVCAGFERNKREWINWCYGNRVNPVYCTMVWNTLHSAPDVATVGARVRPLGECPATVDHRFATMVLPPDFAKPLVVLGASGIGKTTWVIKSMFDRFGVGLSVGDIDVLKQLDPKIHNWILFDEIRFNGDPSTGKGKWPLERQIAICDTELGRTVRCRHTNGVIPEGFPRVFTCTETLPFTQNFQIERRINIVNMYPTHYSLHWQ